MFSVVLGNPDGDWYAEVWSTKQLADKAVERLRRTKLDARLAKLDLEWIKVIEFKLDSGKNILDQFAEN